MIPSGYLLHSHGKSPFFIGKPSISMGHGFHGYVKYVDDKLNDNWMRVDRCETTFQLRTHLPVLLHNNITA